MLLRLHSLARFCHLHRIPFLPRLIKALMYVTFNCILPAKVSVGTRTLFHHHGRCALVHESVEFGSDCNIYNQAVIGAGSTIAAMAVDLSYVLPNSIAVGMPARCIPKKRRNSLTDVGLFRPSATLPA